MRVPSATQRSVPSVNMTPMIDVVFLLIIFFLLSSHLASRETRLPLDIPSAGQHQVPEESTSRLTIQLDQSGQVQLGALVVSKQDFATMLRQQLAANPELQSVRIRTDKTLPYGDVEPLLKEIATAGVVDITFAVRDE